MGMVRMAACVCPARQYRIVTDCGTVDMFDDSIYTYPPGTTQSTVKYTCGTGTLKHPISGMCGNSETFSAIIAPVGTTKLFWAWQERLLCVLGSVVCFTGANKMSRTVLLLLLVAVGGAGGITCPAGQYGSAVGATVCTACAAGKYGTAAGLIYDDCGSVGVNAIQPTYTCSKGTISRLNYANSETMYAIIAPAGANSVTISFTAFNTEYGYDTLKVYQCSSLTSCGTQLLQVSGSEYIPSGATSTTGILRLVWSSDSSVTSTGWSAFWSLPFPCVNCIAGTYSAATEHLSVSHVLLVPMQQAHHLLQAA